MNSLMKKSDAFKIGVASNGEKLENVINSLDVIYYGGALDIDVGYTT